ncbi:MAG: glycosyltransferase family 39 protein [Actinobacteria bacterium]|nr:glycosyltransferase family 39 protein [Actinomycetota bacterium]
MIGFIGVLQSLLVQPAVRRPPFFDEQRYKLWASNALDHGFYGDTVDQFPAKEEFRSVPYSAYVPPGYVFFLIALEAPFGRGNVPVRVSQALLVGTSVVAAGLLAHRVFGSAAAIAAAVAVVVTGTLATYSSFALSEVLAATTLVVAVWLAVVARDRRSWRLMAVSGFVLGISVLVRPQVLLLPPLFAAWCFFALGRQRRGVIAAVALLAGVAVVVMPWTVRNYVRLHAVVPVSTYTWINFWLVNHAGSDGQFHRPERDIGLAAVKGIRAHDELEQDRIWRRMAMTWIREHPREAFKGWIRNGRRYVGDSDFLLDRWYRLRRHQVARFDDRWLLLLAAAAVVLCVRSGGWNLVLPAGVAAYFVAFFCFFVPTARFRVGVLPVVAALAGGVAERLWRLMRRRVVPA